MYHCKQTSWHTRCWTWSWHKLLGSGLREGCLSHKTGTPPCTHHPVHTFFLPASSYVIPYQVSALKCETVCKEMAPCKVSKSAPLHPINWSRERIKCLSQDKNLRSFWLWILYSDHTLILMFQTSSVPEWLFVRNRSLPQLLHSQSQSCKLGTSSRNKEMPIWVSRCQLCVDMQNSLNSSYVRNTGMIQSQPRVP